MNSPVVQSEFGLFDPATDSRTRDAYAVEEARLAAEKSGQCYTGPLWQAPPSSAAVPPPEDGPPLIELYSPSEIVAYEPPPGAVLVGDHHLCRGNLSVIAGPPGCGKSRVLTGLAQAGAIGAGGTWMGLPVHRRFRTLIVQSENGRTRLRNEFAAITVPGIDECVRISSPPDCGLAFDAPDFRLYLARLYDAFPAEVVGIDPWSCVARDDKGRDYREALDNIRECFPGGTDAPAVVIIAHTRKPREDERSSGRALLNVIAGSFILSAAARSAFVMQHATDDTEEDRIVWTPCKNNDGAPGPRSAWHRRDGLFAPCGDFDWDEFEKKKTRRAEITAEVMADVFREGKPLLRAEAARKLMELTGISRSSAFTKIKAFAGIEDAGSGCIRYRPAVA
ncbi:MAG TPA: AAA family ATPase [Verrucomicrobiales bacterium]|nr:AAA family ATPase [Verrucomicrobiales bacterium]